MVVEEPAELFGELAHRRLDALGGVQPVVVDVPQLAVVLGDAGQCVHPVQQAGQLLLAGLGQQEAVERLERPALVRAGDGLPAAEYVVEELALAAVPAGDLLPQLPVQLPEVLLDLAEVGQQFPRGRRELLVAVAHPARVEHAEVARLDARDLVVQLLPAPGQLLDPRLRVGLGAEDDLPQQLEDRVQPGLGADELAVAERAHPLQRLLDRRGGIEVRLVGALGVVLAQPAGLRARPVVEVSPGLLREAARGSLVQREQLVVQAARQLCRGNGTDVVRYEYPVQEAQDQRGVLGAQQPPRRAVGTQPGDLVKATPVRHGTHGRAALRHSAALFPFLKEMGVASSPGGRGG